MNLLFRKLMLVAATAILVLGAASQASAMSITQVTIDLVEIFDTNGSGIIEFGNDGVCDYDEDTSVTKTFTLTETPLTGSMITISMTYSGFDPSSVDSDTYFKINGTTYSDLSEEVSVMTWVLAADELDLGENSITIYLSNYESWLFDHYEDFNVTSWTITYFALVDDTASEVPVPAAVWLLGSGLAGILGFRKKQA